MFDLGQLKTLFEPRGLVCLVAGESIDIKIIEQTSPDTILN